MHVRIKSLNFSAGKPIVFISESDARKINLHAGGRVVIKKDHRQEIGVANIVYDFLKKGEISLSQDLVKRLGAKSGNFVDIDLLLPSKSSEFIKEKLKCDPYSKDELRKIIKDVVNNALTEAELAYFVSGVSYCSMSLKEIRFLIDAIVKTGQTIKWPYKMVADKHSIGGIPGNRTTPIVVSICAAAGIIMPKTSSRAITSAAGTADVIESIAKVDFPISELKKIVHKTGACLAWGGSLGLAPADDRLIQVEKLLNLDPEPQLIASILAKKIAVGSTHVLIDIPFGIGAKVSRREAEELAQKFLKIGKELKLKIKTVLTDGTQPIGNGIGPIEEIKDVIRILKRDNPPKDLEKKSLFLASHLLEMLGKAKKGKGLILAKEILHSGKALKKFEEIITAQRGRINHLPKAKYQHAIDAKKSGTIASISNHKINHIGRLAGCPEDKPAGLYLHKHVNEHIKKGQPLMTIYSNSRLKLANAVNFAKENNVFLY